jgi:small subunit ribosomal protein S3Ae
MTSTADKIKSILKQYQTIIKAQQIIKSNDGYKLRVYVATFTKTKPKMWPKPWWLHGRCSYSSSRQNREIRGCIMKILKKESTNCSLREFIDKLTLKVFSKRIEKTCSGIYPIHSTIVHKVKMMETVDKGEIRTQ